MRWQHKVSTTELIWAWAMYEVQKEDTGSVEDTIIIVGATWTTLGIWAPETRTVMKMGVVAAVTPYIVPAAMALAIPVAIGSGISYAIGGEEGLSDFYHFLWEIPEEGLRLKESTSIVSEKAAKKAATGFEWLVTGASHWIDRKIKEVKGIPGFNLGPFYTSS